MVSSSRRVVVTGMGVISPIGLDIPSFWQSLVAGQGGIRPFTMWDVSGLPVRFGGGIVGFEPRNYFDKKDRQAGKNLKLMARTIQLAVCAAQLAANDAGFARAQLDPTRFGVEFGAGLIPSELEEIGPACQLSANCQPGVVDLEKWGEQGIATMPPLWMLKYLPNMLACHVSILHNAQGPNNTITESDVAAMLALGEARRIIQRDQADVFLVGGADSRLNPLSLVRQCLFQPLSRRNDAPEKACRPFDRNRDGMVLGEGAGVLAIEELEHARRRHARIYAEIVGYGASFDRRRDGAGIARALRAALTEAGIRPDEVDHINAFGNGAIESDIAEARGIHEVFGPCEPPVPVFAAKSYFASMGAGSGTVELTASLLAQQHGILPPTLNHEETDPACPVTVVAGAPRPIRLPYFVKLSFTDMGQCAAVVCRKWE
jgi:3-oxoacyl-[acyl-carrier-protein] synthase II